MPVVNLCRSDIRRVEREIAGLAWVALLFCCGCSHSGLETAPVRGVVKLDGQPLDAGMVFFRPERGRMAVGKIRQDGSYVLSTYEKNGDDGAIVGRHKASVIPPLAEGTLDVAPAMTRPIPEKYQSAGTSLLVYEVEADTNNLIDIELSTKRND
jgi:hypothetical protein